MVTRRADATHDRDNLILAGGAAATVALAVGWAWASLHIAAWIGGGTPPASNPLQLVKDVIVGETAWTTTATLVAAVLFMVALVVVVGAAMIAPKSKRMRPDHAKRHMARSADLAHLTAAGAEATAKRLGSEGVGVPLGETVPAAFKRTGIQLFSSFEDMVIMIAGPRTLKTSAYTVPAVLAAPGPCLATSNKRDVQDITAALRARLGAVWPFDPQGVANTVQSFWWNPLTYIAPVDQATGRTMRNLDGTIAASEVKAKKLAGQFATAARPEGAKMDAYFDPTAEDLIGLLLLAAACGEHSITLVYEWLTDPTETDPVELLRANNFPLHAKALRKLSKLPDKQREGVYGTAQTLMGFLRLRSVTPWVTAQPGMPQFHPDRFARSTDTLYPLSREGEGSVGPLVAALTMAVLDALEEFATQSPGGRLAVPFVGVLDEAANICKLRNLDLQYSHYGSRGIVLFTILQSWAQGADVWGANGIEKLWSSANNKMYGGGVDDDKFLRRLSDLIGTAEIVQRSQSVGRGGRTVSRSIHERSILTVAELRELPKGRAVLFSSGTPAVLIHPLQWFTGPQAGEIQAAMAEEWV